MLGSSARSCAPKISKEISKISMLVNNIKEKGPEEYGRMNITKILKILHAIGFGLLLSCSLRFSLKLCYPIQTNHAIHKCNQGIHVQWVVQRGKYQRTEYSVRALEHYRYRNSAD